MKHSIKMNRALENYKGFKGASTISNVTERLPEELINQLTARQIALVMQAISKAYNDGKASAGAEMIDRNAVYINSIGKTIEWSEEGAEYERKEIKENGYTVTRNVKIKDGVMVPRFL
ncbi:MAG: hypothetical protein ACI4EH_14165 [Oliverpabstia sp.]